MTHPDGRSTDSTAEDWFKENYPAGAGYVHRLDRDTSGVLVFAKNQAAHDFLRKAFHDREAKKTYLAAVYGVPKEKKGTIDFDIGRSRRDFRLRSRSRRRKGGCASRSRAMKSSLTTARTRSLKCIRRPAVHQIRVHLKAIHHPIVNDPLYAPNHPAALSISRLALHAYQLDLPLPSGGRTLITAPVPGDLAPALAHFPEAAARFAVI